MRKLNFWVPIYEPKWHTPVPPSIHLPPPPGGVGLFETVIREAGGRQMILKEEGGYTSVTSSS